MSLCGLVLVFEMGRGEVRCPNIRTSPCGLILMFKMRKERGREERERRGVQAPEHAHTGMLWCLRQGREEGTCPNTRMSLCGLILVFETRGRELVEGMVVGGEGKGRGTIQTQRTRPCGRILCVWVVKGGGKAEGHHQENLLWQNQLN